MSPERSLPAMGLREFSSRLRECSPWSLRAESVRALYAHYRILRRWNERISLVGPGALDRVVERHYGESLAALTEVPWVVTSLADVGSGAGFPGFVLAAVMPRAKAALVEGRERKWAFLRSAAREAGVSVECLLGRVGRALPEGFPATVDLVTLRATKLPEVAWAALVERLSSSGRVLVWAGRDEPILPPSLRRIGEKALPGARWRRILVFELA